MLPVEDEGHVENEEHAVDDGGAGGDARLRARVPAPRRPRGRLLHQHFFLQELLEEQERVGDVLDVVDVAQLGVLGVDVHAPDLARGLAGQQRGALAAAARGHGGRRGGSWNVES